jgi:hypothetical protein
LTPIIAKTPGGKCAWLGRKLVGGGIGEGEVLRGWGSVGEGGSGGSAKVGAEFLQKAYDEKAWNGAEDCVEDEVVCEQGYAKGMLLRGIVLIYRK